MREEEKVGRREVRNDIFWWFGWLGWVGFYFWGTGGKWLVRVQVVGECLGVDMLDAMRDGAVSWQVATERRLVASQASANQLLVFRSHGKALIIRILGIGKRSFP